MVILNESFATVQMDKEIRSIIVIWKGFAKAEDYRLVISTAVAAIEKEGLTSWISDLTNAKVVSPAEKQWIEDEIIPRNIASGIKKTGFVAPKDVFNKIFIDQVKVTLEKIKATDPIKYADYDVQYFSNLQEAKNWIKP